MIKILFSIVLLLFSIPTISQDLDKEKLNKYFQALEENEKFSGSVAILKNGNIIYSTAIGYADFENRIKATKNTKYRIGSISKTYTATLVLKAMENKKLAIDQTIDIFFPNIVNANRITIEQLLNHRSGIHNFTADPDYLSWSTDKKTETELLAIIEKGDSDFEPGSKYKYSNSNYVLLTLILEKIEGKPYSQLIQESIITPLGLEKTYVGSKINIKRNESYSYNISPNWVKQPETDMSIPLGAGAIVANPSDILKFADALFKGKIIKPESLNLMTSIQNNYGLGLVVNNFEDKKAYGHGGAIDGFSSDFLYFPNEDVGIALISNKTNFLMNDIEKVLISSAFNKPFEIPYFTNFKITKDDIKDYLGSYSNKLLNLKMEVTFENNTLYAQASGQPKFPLEPIDKKTFKFDPAKLIITFSETEQEISFILKQFGENKFIKDK